MNRCLTYMKQTSGVNKMLVLMPQMKRILFLFAVTIIARPIVADVDHSSGTYRCNFEIVDESKIIEKKKALELDSNLQFTITRFSYFDLSSVEFDSIINDIQAGYYPSSSKLVMDNEMTHFAYDEEQVKLYSGKTFIAVTNESLFMNFIVLWVKPKIR